MSNWWNSYHGPMWTLCTALVIGLTLSFGLAAIGFSGAATFIVCLFAGLVWGGVRGAIDAEARHR